MSPRVHSDSFEALRAAWYAKLQRANHTDIEAADGTLAYDTGVRRWRAGMRDDLTLAMGGAETIRLVLDYLPNRDRRILGRVLRGESHRDIVKACGCSFSRIQRVVERARELARDVRGRARAILDARAGGASYAQLEDAFGVSRPTIRAIVRAARQLRGEEDSDSRGRTRRSKCDVRL